MARFYISEELVVGTQYQLPDNVVRHLNVLRLRNHEEITLFNGNGKEYKAYLLELDKRHATVEISGEENKETESPLNLMLIQSVSSGERMDFTLQKSVELGVCSIQPVISERSIVRLQGERAEKRVQRWQEIVISACEQSGRNYIPTVLPIITYNQALKQIPQQYTKILLGINQAQKLNEIIPSSDGIAFMVGPEGGWTQEEESQAFKAGFQSVMLGKRILRTETASLAAISAMQTLWGDFI